MHILNIFHKSKHFHDNILTSGDDVENVKAGGIASELLGDGLTIVEFPYMLHGWLTRGDMKDEGVSRDVKKAIQEALKFFKKHV